MLKHGMQTTIAPLLCAQQHKETMMNIVGWKPNKRKLSPLAVIGGAVSSFGMGLANAWSRANDEERKTFPQWWQDLHKKINPVPTPMVTKEAPPVVDSAKPIDDLPAIAPVDDTAVAPLPEYVQPITPEQEHAQAWNENEPTIPDNTMQPDYTDARIVDLAGGN